MLQIKSASLNSKLLTLDSYAHGGNIYRIAEELGVSEGRLVDFSASINPLGISEKVKDVIRKNLNCLVNYPDPDTKALRERIAKCHDTDPETIICGNGSTELIYLIPRALGPKRVLVPAPTFSEYERACKISSESRVQSYELRKEHNFEIIPDEFISAMKVNSKFKIQNSKLCTGDPAGRPYSKPDSAMPCNMAFLCNPNNPTGHLLKRGEVLRIAEEAREAKCFLVVDEAFIDFCPAESVIAEVRDNPFLIVLRSMTKFYALTGLRIGYAVFHEKLIERIKHFREPWTVNGLAQKAAVAALEDHEYSRRTFRLMKKEKHFLESGFTRLGMEFYPSGANYYLLKIPASRCDALRQREPSPPLSKGGIVLGLRDKGILVRDCSNFRGLNNSYIRVAVKSRRHNSSLLKELKDIFGKIPLNPPFSKGEVSPLTRGD
ncbi:MAG: threonine-phosphate decarboxylase [Nitrospirae bacterium]|nr:threonine-phosphate decarboxylase [Nitrospirota bacterium]